MSLGKVFLLGAVAGLLGFEAWRCTKIGFRSLKIPVATAIQESFPELRILHLSDIHLTAGRVGMLDKLAFLQRRKWDFVMVTGDLIDDDSGIEPVCRFLGRFDSSCGKFAVLGNHDFKSIGASSCAAWLYIFARVVLMNNSRNIGETNDIDRLSRTLAENGVRLLRNEATEGKLPEGGEFQVFGIDDPISGLDKPKDLYPQKKSTALRFVLTHGPKAIAKLARLEPELVFCGHTHAGQIRLPGLGAITTRSDADRRNCSGMVQLDGCRLHISPGVNAGRLFSLRFLARPEVTEIILGARDPDCQA
jgi:uncharacterized protein